MRKRGKRRRKGDDDDDEPVSKRKRYSASETALRRQMKTVMNIVVKYTDRYNNFILINTYQFVRLPICNLLHLFFA